MGSLNRMLGGPVGAAAGGKAPYAIMVPAARAKCAQVLIGK